MIHHADLITDIMELTSRKSEALDPNREGVAFGLNLFKRKGEDRYKKENDDGGVKTGRCAIKVEISEVFWRTI